jgi:hypothetical protein
MKRHLVILNGLNYAIRETADYMFLAVLVLFELTQIAVEYATVSV